MKRLIGSIPVILLFLVYIFFFHDSSISLIYEVMIAGYFSGALLVSLFIRKNDPSKGALIMGLGIVSIGPVQTYHLPQEVVQIVPFLLAGLWLQISFSYIMNFKRSAQALADSNHIFLYGTWVAATAVLSVSISLYFPAEPLISKVIALIGAILWLVYMGFSITVIKKMLHIKQKWRNIHGSILLTTVSTQSIVIALEWTFNIALKLEKSLMSIGILFYLISILFLIARYREKDWTLIDDWKNTNCILHGALSITGVAWIHISETPSISNIFWIVVLFLFLFVEGIELIRAVHRVKAFGLFGALGVYHPSQWARIFTFGMFYYFTLMQYLSPIDTFLTSLQSMTLTFLGPSILVLTILQLIVMGYPLTIRNKLERG